MNESTENARETVEFVVRNALIETYGKEVHVQAEQVVDALFDDATVWAIEQLIEEYE